MDKLLALFDQWFIDNGYEDFWTFLKGIIEIIAAL